MEISPNGADESGMTLGRSGWSVSSSLIADVAGSIELSADGCGGPSAASDCRIRAPCMLCLSAASFAAASGRLRGSSATSNSVPDCTVLPPVCSVPMSGQSHNNG